MKGRKNQMEMRTMHEMRTQKLELHVLTLNGHWQRLGYFRTQVAARNAAGHVKGTDYRIFGDDEVKACWQVK
jgi:hypothetical protein